MNLQLPRAMFGPSGSDEQFALQGYKSTHEMPKWLCEQGLELFEYSFGRGVRMSEETANKIADKADEFGVEISVHAPYYINFASNEQEKAENSIRYLTQSLQALRMLRGKRCVFHPGAQGKMSREVAFENTKRMFAKALEEIAALGLDDLIVCPETMGKQAQIGTVDEVAELCTMGEMVYPCMDFGHINSLWGGALKTQDDFQRIIDTLFERIGEEKTKNMHVHFSKIMYGGKGEIKHLTFEDEIYGPNFEPFASVIVKNNLTPHIICESAGTQAHDSAFMKAVYSALLAQ